MKRDSTKVLVTGINGFVGQHMGRYLLSRKIEVLGIGRSPVSSLTHPYLSYSSCDLCDRLCVEEQIQRSDVDYVIHLAAENNAKQSWRQPYSHLQTNILGSLHLLEALRTRRSKRLRGVLVVGSSHEYGMGSPAQHAPQTEKFPVDPQSPYGWSKRLQTSITQMYGELYAIPVVVARTFNLIGPGLKGGICAKLVQQVVEMERGMRPPQLLLGEPDVRRDFLDVRDAVAAYWSLLSLRPFPINEVYNVCANRPYAIGEIAERLRELASRKFSIGTDSQFIPQRGPRTQYGDHSKLRAVTDWEPVYSIEETLRHMLEACRRSA